MRAAWTGLSAASTKTPSGLSRHWSIMPIQGEVEERNARRVGEQYVGLGPRLPAHGGRNQEADTDERPQERRAHRDGAGDETPRQPLAQHEIARRARAPSPRRNEREQEHEVAHEAHGEIVASARERMAEE